MFMHIRKLWHLEPSCMFYFQTWFCCFILKININLRTLQDKFSFPDYGYLLCQWRKPPLCRFYLKQWLILKKKTSQWAAWWDLLPNYIFDSFFRQCWIAHFSLAALRNKPDAQWANRPLTRGKDLVSQNPSTVCARVFVNTVLTTYHKKQIICVYTYPE